MVASIYFDQVQQRYIADSGRPNGNVVGVPVLTAREVYQVLKDLALGVRHLRSVRIHADGGSLTADIDGWALTLGFDGNSLDHCQSCVADDGRLATQQAWPRYGTDPVSLLSVWERAQLERVLPGPVARSHNDQLGRKLISVASSVPTTPVTLIKLS